MADTFIARDADNDSKAKYSPNNASRSVLITSPQKRKAANEDEGQPTEKKKFAMNFNMKKPVDSVQCGSNQKQSVLPIKMSLATQKPKESSATVKPKTAAVAKAFAEDSDEEEMPPEAKMRMRNIGRDTPTAAGPNSFGKGRLGFCDRQKMVEKEIIQHIEEVGED
ncbi:PEST proteolytic signal-containing nuclear protein-like [Mizuhopecten yessoensis]|uniref:PEST proteolytic signal-containing nuclear protein n=1 Tax=Mizuhopecten yessoensis TaxID=6573 RepID=A0A210QJS5_MIZYE|nr:PEST proteolytic signal-containing nuclear protein-like [Mizuhopecten yessoensis]OWF49000.1 PEST proteolytic signal-containing nuclear protein [Mizuhopecten yessoensis]